MKSLAFTVVARVYEGCHLQWCIRVAGKCMIKRGRAVPKIRALPPYPVKMSFKMICRVCNQAVQYNSGHAESFPWLRRDDDGTYFIANLRRLV